MRARVRAQPGRDVLAHRPHPSAVGTDHPLLQLQRTAGNSAVTALVQRETPWGAARRERQATFFFSKIAMNVPMSLYKGKTDATFEGVRVERHWSWGLLADDLAIVFKCGPQRFRFETTKGGGGLFPWRMLDRFGGSGGWVIDPIRQALTTIYQDWDHADRFHAATRVVIDALAWDVAQYREREAAFRRAAAPA